MFRSTKILLLTGLVLLLGVGFVPGTGAASLTVCSSGCDYTTIQAVIDATGTVNGDTIIVTDGVHTEYGIMITKDLNIQGLGTGVTFVQADVSPETAPDRVFFIASATQVTIRNMTIRHGYVVADPAQGGGIYNDGDLTLDSVAINLNNVKGEDRSDHYTTGEGGGLFNNCQLLALDSSFSNNTADGGLFGGGVRGPSRGGALYNNNEMEMRSSTISLNSARVILGEDWSEDTFGGGIYNTGSLDLVNVSLINNAAKIVYVEGSPDFGADAFGGGLYNEGTISCIESYITDNTASAHQADIQLTARNNAYGGGIYNSGSLIINKTTIANNEVFGSQSVLYPSVCAQGGDAFGGGIYHADTAVNLTITSSTVNSNYLLGGNCYDGGSCYGSGIYSDDAPLLLTNCTVSGNDMDAGTCGMHGICGSVFGGGIYAMGNMSLISCTIYLNDGSGYITTEGLGIYSGNSTNTLNNCIVALNYSKDIAGSMTSEDYNLVNNPDGWFFFGNTAHNVYQQNPSLSSLANNGGPTQTHALKPGSPAIDAGSGDVSGQIRDQRNFLRPYDDPSRPNADDACDIGSYEYLAVAVVPSLSKVSLIILCVFLSFVLGSMKKMHDSTEE